MMINPRTLPWWGWLLGICGLYLVQMVFGPATDRGGLIAWVCRIAAFAGMVLCVVMAVMSLSSS